MPFREFKLRIGPPDRPLIARVRMARRDMKPAADVQNPSYFKSPRIRIRRGLSPAKQAGALIHEILHLADWGKDEEWIEDTERALVEALVKAGLIDGDSV